jgi:hypothetical protein
VKSPEEERWDRLGGVGKKLGSVGRWCRRWHYGMLNSFKDNNADVLLFSQLHIIIIIWYEQHNIIWKCGGKERVSNDSVLLGAKYSCPTHSHSVAHQSQFIPLEFQLLVPFFFFSIDTKLNLHCLLFWNQWEYRLSIAVTCSSPHLQFSLCLCCFVWVCMATWTQRRRHQMRRSLLWRCCY